MWRLEFDAMRAEGGCLRADQPPVPVTGRPSRAAALECLIAYVCSLDDVWVTHLGAIAEHVRGLGLTPRSVQRPNPADF